MFDAGEARSRSDSRSKEAAAEERLERSRRRSRPRTSSIPLLVLLDSPEEPNPGIIIEYGTEGVLLRPGCTAAKEIGLLLICATGLEIAVVAIMVGVVFPLNTGVPPG